MEQAELAIVLKASETTPRRETDRAEVERISREAPRFDRFPGVGADGYGNRLPNRDEMMQAKMGEQLLDQIRRQKAADAQQRKEMESRQAEMQKQLEARQAEMQNVRGTSFFDAAKQFNQQPALFQPVVGAILKLRDAMEQHRGTILSWNKLAADTGQPGAQMPLMAKLSSGAGIAGAVMEAAKTAIQLFQHVRAQFERENALNRQGMRADIALDPVSKMRAELDFLRNSWRAGAFSSIKESFTGQKAALLEFLEGFQQGREKIAQYSPSLNEALMQDRMAQMQGDLRRSGILGGPMSEYQRLATEVLQAKQDLSALKNLEELPKQMEEMQKELTKTRGAIEKLGGTIKETKPQKTAFDELMDFDVRAEFKNVLDQFNKARGKPGQAVRGPQIRKPAQQLR